MNETLALIALMLGAGWLCARMRWLPGSADDTLNRFVIYICLPALVLTTVPQLQWQWDLLAVVLTPWLLLAVGAGLVHVADRVLSLSSEARAVLLLCVPLGNTSFLGFPMLEALLGRESVRIAVLYDQFGSFLILTTYGFFVVAQHSADVRPGAATLLRRIVTFPSFGALCVGLVIPSVPQLWPDAARAVAVRLADTLVPLAMFAVGLKLQLRAPRPRRALVVGLLLKLGVLPAVALALVKLLALDDLPAQVIVLESAMPSMVTAGALAMMAGLAPDLAAALVGYGIVASLVSLPLWSLAF